MTKSSMKVRLEADQIIIELPENPNLKLLIEGELQAEYTFGRPDGPQNIQAKLAAARASIAACDWLRQILVTMRRQAQKPDHLIRPNQRPAAFAAGLESGLMSEGQTVGKDPMVGFPGSRVAPDHKLSGPSHNRGWEMGNAIWRALAIADAPQSDQ